MSAPPAPPRPASSQPPPPPRPSVASGPNPLASMGHVSMPAGAPPAPPVPMFPSAPPGLPPSMPTASRPAAVSAPQSSFPPPSLSQSSMPAMPPHSMPSASSMPMMPMEAPAAGRRGMLMGAAGVAAIAAVGYLFMSGPDTGDLAISVSGPGGKPVSGVVVLVDGAEACQDSVCKVTELEKGSHKVSARAPGYDESAPKLVSVKAGEEEVLNLELVSSTAGTGLVLDFKAPGVVLEVGG